MIRPQLWVFAGPNGSGKSTLAAAYVQGRIPLVNPDDIAKAAGENVRALNAGRTALLERTRLLESGITFAVETTLTGNSEIALMRAAQASGYKVNLIFICLRDVMLSIARVEGRVQEGGHNVPVVDLLRRFDRSLANLPEAAALADRLIVIDNSDVGRRLIYWREDGRAKFVATSMPDWLPNLPR